MTTDTHPSMLCGKCMMPSSNENATDDWERSHREPIDMKQSEHHTHYRCLPGPREDEE